MILVLLSAGCLSSAEEKPAVIAYDAMEGENITLTVVTYNEENTTYYGRIKQVIYYPDTRDIVIFQDNLTVPCDCVMYHNWAAARMHTLTVDNEWQCIDGY